MNHYTLRQANIDDAQSLIKFIKQLESESEYLLCGSGERRLQLERVESYLQKIQMTTKPLMYVAVDNKQNIVGFVCGETSSFKRISHVIKVNIGLLKKVRRTRLARELGILFLQKAREAGIVRIEATVIKENKLSLNLCKKFGAKIEGLKESSIKIGDRFYDEYLLAKIL